MDDLECDQLVVLGVAAGDEEEGRISTVNDLGIWETEMSDFKASQPELQISLGVANLCTLRSYTCVFV